MTSIYRLISMLGCRKSASLRPSFFQWQRYMSFDPDLVHVVDRMGENILFRGNVPIQNNIFVYDKLLDVMSSLLITQNYKMPLSPYLIVISLLNEATEWWDIDLERSWFAQHSDHGYFLHQPIFGALTRPQDYPAFLRCFFSRYVPFLDRLDKKVLLLRRLLSSRGQQPKIIYLHCEAGKDRSGQLSAAYAMRYHAKSYQYVLEHGYSIAGRPMDRVSRYALQWYAVYLKYVLGYTTIGGIHTKSLL